MKDAPAYDRGNIFAKILRGEANAHRVYEDDRTLAILDVMPQSDGHALVLPKAEARDLFDLPPDMLTAVAQTSRRIAVAARTAFRPITSRQYNGAAADRPSSISHARRSPLGKSVARPRRGFRML